MGAAPHRAYRWNWRRTVPRKNGMKLQSFWRDERGQDLVEYALAAGMVAVAAVAVMPTLSSVVSNVFSKIGSLIGNTVN